MKTRLQSALLAVSGLSAAGVGASLLLAPVAFQASAGIMIAEHPSLLSETRAPGGALLGIGILVLGGAFVRPWAATATFLSAVVYLSYGLSRALSVWLDGMPAPSLVIAMVLELMLGAACLVTWLRRPIIGGANAAAR